MKQLLVISGKGGTGKTSITAALAALAGDKILVDLDVDAPDMHLILSPSPRRREPFVSGAVAEVRPEDCTACGLCADLCAYEAISLDDAGIARVDGDCEGCKLCVAMCPVQAIDFPARECGQWYISDTRLGTMVHALLHPGQENSGRLVSLLREQARELAEHQGINLVLADGTPGIGCPVISSLTGVDLALIVTEPTPSGLHDLERVVGLGEHFKVSMSVLINKADLNGVMAGRIEDFCASKGIPCLGRLDFDPAFVEAMIQGKSIVEFAPQSPTAEKIRGIWQNLSAELM